MDSKARPGIEALEVYFPSQYVSQSKLEEFDGVSQGKYTIGLGQDEMCFCSDVENVHSLALTVVSNLMKKSAFGYEQIGRLTVSSETIVDKSKSIKSVLMQLFEKSGNHDVEGVDYLNACYGGTAGFFDAVHWIQSEDWDGRRAIVVAVDIAEYAPGSARPTGGAGAIAMLIGPEPTISLEMGRASFMKHAYDFYKPFLSSPFPVVNGKLSNECYLESVDECYAKLAQLRKVRQHQDTHLTDWDYVVFHSPYNKLVQKSFGRLMYNDFLLHPGKEEYADFQKFLELDKRSTYSNREIYKSFAKASKAEYERMVQPSTVLPKKVGNCYTASMYMALASLAMEKEAEDLVGTNLLAFSYGSGLCSSLFQLKFSTDLGQVQEFQRNLDFAHRLNDRLEVSPKQFTTVMDEKDKQHRNEREAFVPSHTQTNIAMGTYFVKNRTDDGRFNFDVYTSTTRERCQEI